MATLNKISVDNVVYDIGGSTECLIVTLNDSATTASHSPAEIRQALLEGIPAYLKWADLYSDGEGTALFIPFHYAETNGTHPELTIAVATYMDTISSEGIEYIQTVTIKEDKSVEIKTRSAVNELELERYLSKTNTTEYTPSADYHPATKKYVDDHAGANDEVVLDFRNESDEAIINKILSGNQKTRFIIDDEGVQYTGIAHWNNPRNEDTGLIAGVVCDIPLYQDTEGWTGLGDISFDVYKDSNGNYTLDRKFTQLEITEDMASAELSVPTTKTVKDYVANYKLKGDFAVIEGSHVLTANTEDKVNQNSSMQTQWQIDFPSGFDKDNCVCLCFGAKSYEDRCYAYGFNTSPSMGTIKGTVERTIVLGWNQDTTKINLEAYNMATSERTLWYRIVLMKI